MPSRKLHIYLFFTLSILASLYSLAWINVGYEAKRSFRALIAELENFAHIKIRYKDMRLGGFPFGFSVVMDGLRISGEQNPYRNGNYEIYVGDIALYSDLLLKRFKTSLDKNMHYSVAVDDEDERIIFKTMVNYKPRIDIKLAKSLLKTMLDNDALRRFTLSLDEFKYDDNGYEALDENNNVLYATRGNNNILIKIISSQNKRNGAKVNDARITADFNIKPEHGDFEQENVPVIFGHAFAVKVDGEVRLPSDSTHNLYAIVNSLQYVDENFSISCVGSGGLIPMNGMVGSFHVAADNYENFFKKAVRGLFYSESSYEEFKRKILGIADKVEDGKLFITYKSGNSSAATIGHMKAVDLLAFTLEKLGLNQNDISARAQKLMTHVQKHGTVHGYNFE